MSIILTLSSNSLRNTTIDSNAEDIHYVISTPQGPFSATSITTIRRLDKDSGEYVLVAQLETNIYKKDRMRLLNPTVTSDFVPVDELLKRNALLASTRTRTFVACDGHPYMWKYNRRSLTLVSNEETGTSNEIASGVDQRLLFRRRKAQIKLQRGSKRILDSLIPTFLFVEGKRRQMKSGG